MTSARKGRYCTRICRNVKCEIATVRSYGLAYSAGKGVTEGRTEVLMHIRA